MEQTFTKVLTFPGELTSAKWEPGFQYNATQSISFAAVPAARSQCSLAPLQQSRGRNRSCRKGSVQPELEGDVAQLAHSLITT